MKKIKLNIKQKNQSYPLIIGPNILSNFSNFVKNQNLRISKYFLVIDKNVPKNMVKNLTSSLNKKNTTSYYFSATEKNKDQKNVDIILNIILKKNFSRNDCIVAVGGGITGDVTAYVASLYKRGMNFINVPTTLLSQVDAAVGGKTGVNSKYGKNLIGSFSQPKLVISDTSFLKSLTKKEMVCGYAEILKHAVINDKKFFNWLKLNTKYIFSNESKKLIYAIKKSCKIKLFFVNKDFNERNLRMILNFGHTFAHAIEVKNNYSKNITHGEAVLAGIILATKLSIIKKVCNKKTLSDLMEIYSINNLNYTFKKYLKIEEIMKLIPYLKNDKKNNDNRINFILLKKIGKTSMPNEHKISIYNLKKYIRKFTQY